MAKQSRAQKSVVGRVMHEFALGELGSPKGRKVKSRRQAIAIALSEAGESKFASPAKNARNLRRTERRERQGKTAEAETEGKAAQTRTKRKYASRKTPARKATRRTSAKSVRKSARKSTRKASVKLVGSIDARKERANAPAKEPRQSAGVAEQRRAFGSCCERIFHDDGFTCAPALPGRPMAHHAGGRAGRCCSPRRRRLRRCRPDALARSCSSGTRRAPRRSCVTMPAVSATSSRNRMA